MKIVIVGNRHRMGAVIGRDNPAVADLTLYGELQSRHFIDLTVGQQYCYRIRTHLDVPQVASSDAVPFSMAKSFDGGVVSTMRTNRSFDTQRCRNALEIAFVGFSTLLLRKF